MKVIEKCEELNIKPFDDRVKEANGIRSKRDEYGFPYDPTKKEVTLEDCEAAYARDMKMDAR